jgi:hypothetical protein
MTFSTGTLSRCAGGSHFELPITIGGVTRTLSFSRDEFIGDPPADISAAREAILSRLRSAAKEAGASTLPQIQAAIGSISFQI